MNYSGHKYGMSANGSKLEKALGDQLRLRVVAGELENLKEQVRVQICCQDPDCPSNRRIHSIVDFAATDTVTRQTIFFEAKGFETPEWRIKRRLWMHRRLESLEIWKGTYKRPYLDEEIVP